MHTYYKIYKYIMQCNYIRVHIRNIIYIYFRDVSNAYQNFIDLI